MNETIQKAIDWIRRIANDNSHGYQWGGWGPDYDCGHLVIMAWQENDVPVRTAGASYTGNMRTAFMRCNFADVTQQINLATGGGLQAGDVLVNQANHAAMYVGNGRLVQARSNFDGKAGDGSGGEIREQAYYNYPWDVVLRYKGGISISPAPSNKPVETKPTNMITVSLPVLSKGSKGGYVTAMQDLLIGNGFSCAPYGSDGSFGTCTYNSLVKFQKRCGLTADGICGKDTWTRLLGGGDG